MRNSNVAITTDRQQGFTLIELIMVIVILGILAATALPKFANMQNDARFAAIKGAHGAINSAIAIAHSQALLNNKSAPTGDSITLEGNTVTLAYGYPTADENGIVKAVTLTGDISWTKPGQIAGFSPDKEKCRIVYTAATSTAVPASASLNATSSDECA